MSYYIASYQMNKGIHFSLSHELSFPNPSIPQLNCQTYFTENLGSQPSRSWCEERCTFRIVWHYSIFSLETSCLSQSSREADWEKWVVDGTKEKVGWEMEKSGRESGGNT
jgi:hypothetical protein